MTVTEFLTKAFQGQVVDVYCGGKERFSGKLKNCSNGVVTLLAPKGDVQIHSDKILSVSEHING